MYSTLRGLALGAFFGGLLFLSTLHLFTGLADNGDFLRDLCPFMVKPVGFSAYTPTDPGEHERRFVHAWYDRWELLPAIDASNLCYGSSHELLVLAEVLFNRTVYSQKEFSLTVGSLVPRMMLWGVFLAFSWFFYGLLRERGLLFLLPSLLLWCLFNESVRIEVGMERPGVPSFSQLGIFNVWSKILPRVSAGFYLILGASGALIAVLLWRGLLPPALLFGLLVTLSTSLSQYALILADGLGQYGRHGLLATFALCLYLILLLAAVLRCEARRGGRGGDGIAFPMLPGHPVCRWPSPRRSDHSIRPTWSFSAIWRAPSITRSA